MTGSVQRPLLFLDVDGPLIPFGTAQQYPTYQTGPELSETDSNPLLARVNPEHGPRLAALPCDPVWATTWMTDANEYIAPRIGLPQLAVVIWPEPSDVDEQDEQNGLHWKTRALVDWAAGRSFAWVDDEMVLADTHPGGVVVAVVESTLTSDKSVLPERAAPAIRPCRRAEKTPASRQTLKRP
ncbi:hypothetical protein QFZ67_000392 [Streptomyces sp. V1I1]|nr:hypothetical protein [Streptomyces sp. V1I1]